MLPFPSPEISRPFHVLTRKHFREFESFVASLSQALPSSRHGLLPLAKELDPEVFRPSPLAETPPLISRYKSPPGSVMDELLCGPSSSSNLRVQETLSFPPYVGLFLPEFPPFEVSRPGSPPPRTSQGGGSLTLRTNNNGWDSLFCWRSGSSTSIPLSSLGPLVTFHDVFSPSLAVFFRFFWMG